MNFNEIPFYEPRIQEALQAFNLSLNIAPPHTAYRKTPDGKASYLPISWIESQLLKHFGVGRFSFKNLKQEIILNQLCTQITVELIHPITNSKFELVGNSSAPIQVDAFLNPNDLKGAELALAKKKHNADPINQKATSLSMLYQSEKSGAINNACRILGVAYGWNMNRKEEDTHYVDVQIIDYNRERAIELIQLMENELGFDKTLIPQKLEELKLPKNENGKYIISAKQYPKILKDLGLVQFSEILKLKEND